MENQEINLAKINEQDWEKYRKMNKVASRPSTTFMLFAWIPSLGTEPELPRRFKGLQRRISYVQKREEKLKKYGFTKREITWYHAVRSELIKLGLEYTL